MSLLDEPANRFHLDVGFFDDQERKSLLRYPTANRILEIVKSGVSVNTAQFLTYYMFHKRRPGKEGFRDYSQLGSKIGHAAADLDGWVAPSDGSLGTVSDVEAQDRAITERIGEAASLCVASEIHDIHDADWDRLPEHRGRSGFATFDFQYDEVFASDGSNVIQVEAKGTSVEDTRILTPSMRTHKSNIDAKKRKIRQREAEDNYTYPADLRYGIICAIGHHGPLRCLLTDPPGENGADPRRFRLLARLQFMFNWISFLSGRSQLAASFATRLHALMELQDPFALAGIPLLRGNGRVYEIAPPMFGRVPSMFAHLCRVRDGQAIGTLVRAANEQCFFLGVQRHIFEMAVTQDFEKVLLYKDPGGSIYKTLECVIPRGRAKSMNLEYLDRGNDERSGYISFNASGTLHYSQGGVVFGKVIPGK